MGNVATRVGSLIDAPGVTIPDMAAAVNADVSILQSKVNALSTGTLKTADLGSIGGAFRSDVHDDGVFVSYTVGNEKRFGIVIAGEVYRIGLTKEE